MVARQTMKAGAILALASSVLLAGCQKPPRGASYFEAHPDEAKIIAAQCRAGTNTSDECAAAELVAGRDQHKADLERELGNTKRQPDKAMHF